jgi:penicillin amidase
MSRQQQRVFTCKNMLVIMISALILGVMFSVLPWVQPNGGLWADIHWANLPPYSSYSVPGLDDEVEILRDQWGVPHIFGNSLNDTYFASGYVHAQDRLFQLDLTRRTARGKLSELFGPSFEALDLLHRQLSFNLAANATEPLLSPSVLSLVQRYTDGINYYINTIGSRLSVEFRTIGYFPTPWTVRDTLIIERYLAWQLSENSAFDDLALASLIGEYGANLVFQDLFPETHYNDIPTVPTLPPEILQAAQALREDIQHIQQINPLSSPQSPGSNCWVVNGSHTDTGYPMLASDPHFALKLPSVWYEMHLIAPGLNVQGITYPGIPFIYQGHNPNIGWAWTGMKSDVTDFYYYIWNATDTDQYWWNGDWHTIETRSATILTTTVTLKYTVHGPLFSEPDGDFALKWTGYNGSQTLEALYNLGLATNYAEFLSAISLIECPNLNFLYADTSDNIAYHATGAHPIRAPGLGPSLHNGSAGTEDWQGFIPFSSLPNITNPASGYIVSANNKPVNPSYPYYLGFNFAPAHRANRITQLVNTTSPLSLADMATIQQDVLSLHALAIKDIVASVVLAQVTASSHPVTHAAATALQGWNGEMTADSVAATIWASFSQQFLNHTFYDEYSQAGVPTGPYPAITVLENFTQINYGRWFNNTLQAGTQTRDDIIFSSFVTTKNELVANLGTDVTNWQYNRVHALWMLHPMASTFPYMSGPIHPLEGSTYTVNHAPGFLVDFGASYRVLLDFQDFDNSLSVIAGGQRLNVYSTHYLDQLNLWLLGDYHPLLFPSSISEMTDFVSNVHFIPE